MDFLSYDFLRRALSAAALAGPVCGFLGVFLTARGMAFFSDALAHTAITGVALGLLGEGAVELWLGLTLPPGLPSGLLIFWCLGAAWVMASLFESARWRPDTVMAFCFTGSVAFGVLVLGKLGRYGFLEETLFGDINANSWGDVAVLGVVTGSAVILLGRWLREFLLILLDEDLALADGIPVRRLNRILVLLVAAVVAIALKLLGALLVSALLVVPAAAARLVAPNLRLLLVFAGIGGFLASVVGVILSFYLDLATGPTIVLTHLALLLIALTLQPLFGRRRRSQRRGSIEATDSQSIWPSSESR
ncbi:metal ABC transporter permease [Verrucomicrobium sp. 3C]|uniref:metal ABC transporter permease n=1 Tax=Verrucomicrobium sp. 3C TaxID=1134055 RepID=UPI000382E82F|nr:metal ABC transporter permease [Verrucomicrobium sp. 3C]